MSLSKNKADINKFSGPRINNSKPTTIKNTTPEISSWSSSNIIPSKNNKLYEVFDVVKAQKAEKEVQEKMQESQIAKNNHNSNDFSDCDNIEINEVQKIMVDLKNSMGEEAYNKYIKYIKGKKLSDLVYKKDVKDKNGKVIHRAGDLKKLDVDEAKKYLNPTEIARINKAISEDSNKDGKQDLSFGSTKGKIKLSNEMLNSKIHDVKNTKSGYDAMIFVTEKGQPILVNSSTNPESPEDIAAIALAMANQIIGPDGAEEFIDQIYDSLAGDDLAIAGLKEKVGADKYEALMNIFQGSGVDADAIKEQIYNGQIKDNQDAIKECVEIAKKNGTKAILSGYSLGGGIQLAAYESLTMEDDNVGDYIKSVSVYNPYIGFAEQYQSINGEDLIDSLGRDEKVSIYSAEQDYVSTFNDSLPRLKDRITFVRSKDLGVAKDAGEILGEFIVGGSSNHGFANLDMDSFDKDGNIKKDKEGDFIPVNVSIEDLAKRDDKKQGQDEKYRLSDENFKENFRAIVKTLFNFDDLKKGKKIKEDSPFGFIDWGEPPKDATGRLMEKLKEYLIENIGKYKYDDLADTLVDGLWGIILEKEEDMIKKIIEDAPDQVKDLIKTYIGDEDEVQAIANLTIDEDQLKRIFKDFLTDDENKQIIINLVYSKIKNNKEDYDFAAKQLTRKLKDLYKGEDLGMIEYIENAMKDGIIEQVEELISKFEPEAVPVPKKSPKKIKV